MARAADGYSYAARSRQQISTATPATDRWKKACLEKKQFLWNMCLVQRMKFAVLLLDSTLVMSGEIRDEHRKFQPQHSGCIATWAESQGAALFTAMRHLVQSVGCCSDGQKKS